MYNRICPKCGIKINYKSKINSYNASKKKSLCKKCANNLPNHRKKISDANKGKNHPLYGKHHSKKSIEKMKESKKDIGEETIEKMSMSHKGKKLSPETIEKIRKSLSGENNPNFGKFGKNNPLYGKKHSEHTIDKMKSSAIKRSTPQYRKKFRKMAINRIEKNKLNGNQLSPNFNPSACEIIEKYGEENGYNFQHAMNGGEFYVKDLGYWVDGYDGDKNVVIEIDEKRHFNKDGTLKEKDIIRQKEIKNFLDCKFIRLRI